MSIKFPTTPSRRLFLQGSAAAALAVPLAVQTGVGLGSDAAAQLLGQLQQLRQRLDGALGDAAASPPLKG